MTKDNKFIDGAVMAYRDCAEFTNKLAENLPPELSFLKPQFQELANGFIEKSNNALEIANDQR